MSKAEYRLLEIVVLIQYYSFELNAGCLVPLLVLSIYISSLSSNLLDLCLGIDSIPFGLSVRFYLKWI